MAELTVVATVVAKRECIDEVRRELLGLVPPTRDEAGCISYTLHQDNDDPAVFIFHETWESEEALARHMGTPHFAAYLAAVAGKIADKVVHRMSRIA